MNKSIVLYLLLAGLLTCFSCTHTKQQPEEEGVDSEWLDSLQHVYLSLIHIYRIAHNGHHGIGRDYKFLRLSHHVSSEEKQQNNQAFVFQKHSVVICSVLQRANV